MSGQRYCQNFDKIREKYFFTKIGNRTVCLLCGFEPAIVKKRNVARHFLIHHAKYYASYERREKLDVIKGLKLVHQESRTDVPEKSSSEKARKASSAISYLMAKNGISCSDGKFIKKCLIVAVKCFGNSITLEEAENLHFSINAEFDSGIGLQGIPLKKKRIGNSTPWVMWKPIDASVIPMHYMLSIRYTPELHLALWDLWDCVGFKTYHM